jgi:ketosteroid isomerase-like protein
MEAQGPAPGPPGEGMAMDTTEEFRTVVMKRFAEAERALHGGDLEPRLALWSRQDPVTLFGAEATSRSGWAEIEPLFQWLAARFAGVTDYRMDLLACDAIGDMGYTVAFEHTTTVLDGTTREYTLRATHVWRREDGEWKIVHRHGDVPPADKVPVVGL